MASMLRQRNVGFLVTEEEWAALERASKKDRRNVSSYIRDALLLDLMLDFDHTFMTEVRRQIRQRIEEKSFQRELPIERKKRA